MIDVSVRASLRTTAAGIAGPWAPVARPRGHRLDDDIPVTSAGAHAGRSCHRTCPIAVERAVNEADKRDLIDPETLRIALDRYTGEPASGRCATSSTSSPSASPTPISRSSFARSRAAAGLSSPLSKQIVNGFEVDFFWPDLGLVVETDGLRYHRTPSTQTRDARRDRTHVLAGMTPLRFTHYEIRYEPAPGPDRAPPKRHTRCDAHPTLTTPAAGSMSDARVAVRAPEASRRRRRPCIRRRRRAWRRRPRRSRRRRRGRRGSGAGGCPRRGRRRAGPRAWPRRRPGRGAP